MHTLRVNDALLIADQAFRPYQCVAWALPEGNGELNLTIFDRTQKALARAALPKSLYLDQEQLVQALAKQRNHLTAQGAEFLPWQLEA